MVLILFFYYFIWSIWCNKISESYSVEYYLEEANNIDLNGEFYGGTFSITKNRGCDLKGELQNATRTHHTTSIFWTPRIEPSDIIFLSVNEIWGSDLYGFKSWGIVITISANPLYIFSGICIGFTQYQNQPNHIDNDEDIDHYAAMLNLSKLKNASLASTHRIISFKIWNLHKMILDVSATADNVYYQQITFISPLPANCVGREHCDLDPFIYMDHTNNVIHVAHALSNNSVLYDFLCENSENKNFSLLNNFHRMNEVTEIYECNATFCKIRVIIEETSSNLTMMSVGCVTLLLVLTIGITFLLWCQSLPKRKTLCAIFCQCEKHIINAQATRKLFEFLETHCYVHVFEPSLTIMNECDVETKILEHHRSEKPDIIIFVPFPKLEEHQRNYEAECHAQCEIYKACSRKVELLLPFEELQRQGSISCEWSEKSYKKFLLFQDFSNFIKFIHPFYLFRCLERVCRKKLWGPHLEALLNEQSFTNDHFRDITNPKLCAFSNPTNHNLFLNLNLEEILCEPT